MPWTPKDVDEHIKGLNASQKQTWCDVANKTLADCKAKGGSDCEGKAVRIANSVFSKKEHELGDNCICPECGYKEKHEKGVPCQTIKCEKCGAYMVREILKEVKKNFVTEIKKVSLEKRLVGGTVLRANEVDLQGDIYYAETVEECAHDFMENTRVMGFMHGKKEKLLKMLLKAPVDKEELAEAIDIVKSLELPKEKEFGIPVDSMFFSPEIIKMVKDGEIAENEWFMVAKITEDSVLKKIESGDIKGFSIGAVCEYEMLEEEGEE